MGADPGSAWLCPACGAETDPYSNICEHCRHVHMGRLRGVPSDAAGGEELLSGSREIPDLPQPSVAETWANRPVPFRVICPTCGAPNIVHVENYNCCFECGQKMFVSPIEQEALAGDSGRPAAKKRESHGAYAVEMTFKVIYWVAGIGFGLWLLAYSWPILLAGAIVLLPIYLFFNVWSRVRGRR